MRPLFPEFTRVEVVVPDAVLLLMGALAVGTAVGLLVTMISRVARCPTMSWRILWRRHRRAVRSFAAAVTGGDMALAEIQAQVVLGRNDRTKPARPYGWDERIVLDCNWAQGAADLGGVETLAARFPGIRRTHDDGTTDVLVGRHRRIQLRLLSERLVPPEGVRFVADAGGPGHHRASQLAPGGAALGAGHERRSRGVGPR